MKSCLGLLITLLIFTFVVGGGALIWYLSDTAEFSRSGLAVAVPAPPPKAIPVRPGSPATGRPPLAAPAPEPARR